MTEIYCEDYSMPSADMGDENRMADIKNISYIHAGYKTSANFDEEDKKYLGHGMINTMLPYLQQDGYNRELKMKKWKAVVLENEKLKATFLPELGGRLWSLFDKVHNKELLYVNKVFEPCNLALRNAWFSGGVEWNLGIKGHNPLTASPMFTALGTTKEGDRFVSFYEYERIRELVYSVNAVLPDDSDVLYITTTVENKKDTPAYMYWWSNIAVDDADGCRVIVPAEESILCHYYEGNYTLDKVPFPYQGDKDFSYPKSIPVVADYFYKIKKEEQKWFAAVDENGYGLLETSDPFLAGRKLFSWGQKQGGKNWASFLAGDKNDPYIEIQAGILTTQLEHIPMPANSMWQWTETYGAVSVDPAAAHADWKTACAAVAEKVGEIPKKTFTVTPPEEIICFGEGWGCVESKYRKISDIFSFPEESLNEKQTEWLNLARNKVLTETDPCVAPRSYLTAFWVEELLENAVNSGKENWNTLYHLGTCKYAHGDLKAAEDFWKKSVESKENAWSYRNLAMLYHREYGDSSAALSYIEKGYVIGGNHERGYLYDLADVCLACGTDGAQKFVSYFDRFADEFKQNGRLRLSLVKAYIVLERLDAAREILNENFLMPDIREGEVSISQVWYNLYGKILVKEGKATENNLSDALVDRYYPIPQNLDFRMS